MTLMEIDDFDYELPTNLIAQQPAKVRGDSKLLIVNPNKSSLLDSNCKNFYDYLFCCFCLDSQSIICCHHGPLEVAEQLGLLEVHNQNHRFP